MALAVIVPAAATLALIPLRSRWSAADIVLVLVAVEILASFSGSILAGCLAIASVAALFDVFFTRPYGQLGMVSSTDAIAGGLLVAVGVVVLIRVIVMRASIADRARQVAELEASNRMLGQLAARFQTMIEAAPDAIVGVDRAGLIRLANDQASQLFGYRREDLLGRPVEALMPRAARAAHAAHRAVYQDDPKAQCRGPDQDPAALRQDGTSFPAAITLSALDLDGDPIVLAAVRDMTERRVAETTIRRLASAVLHADEAIITKSADGTILSWNLGAEHLYGYTEQEIVGQPVSMVIPPGLERENAELTRDVLRTHRRLRRETTRRRKDGTMVEVQVSMSPIADAAGTVTELLTITSDISARKRAERALAERTGQLEERTRELEASNRELAEFAYIASHDLREPLRKISSFCQLLAERYQGRLDRQADEYIAFVVEGAARMQQLIEDVLAFSRAGRRVGMADEADCRMIVKQVITDLSALIEETGACVSVTGTLPVLHAEPGLLTQVFENLVGNAIKFRGGAPPQVTVRATREERGWRFAVADNGIGIEPEYADRVFGIFQRLHSREEYPGSGIGLAICKKIVEAYGGTIWFESQPGAGTTFYWTFPVGEVAP